MSHFCSASTSRQQGVFEGRQLSNLVWSSATLNRRNTELLDAITPYAVRMCQDRDTGETTPESINEYFDQQEIGNLLWSCAVMDHFPPDLIRVLYRGIVGEGSEQQLDFMSRFHDDTRLQVGYFRSLLYVSILDHESVAYNECCVAPIGSHSLTHLMDWSIGSLTSVSHSPGTRSNGSGRQAQWTGTTI